MQEIALQLFESSPQAVMVTDLENNIVSVNPAFQSVTGYTLAEVMGENPRLLGAGQQNESFYEDLWLQLTNEGYWQGELWNRHKNGNVYPALFSIFHRKNSQGEVTGYIAQFINASEFGGDVKAIAQQAQYDELTHLPNWGMFEEMLQTRMIRGAKQNEQLAVMLIDLDRFKWINDTLGRAIGDSLLQEVARRLGSVIRGEDALARLNSDEFIMMLPNVDGAESAIKVAQRVVEQLSHGIFVEHREIFISASVGIALTPDHAERAKDLVKKADVAMYAAKQGGRNTFRVYSALMERSKGPQILREENLETALVSGDIEMTFMPVYSIYSHQVVAVHARPSWKHSELGNVPFAEFSALLQGRDSLEKYEEWLDKELQALTVVWERFPKLRFISFSMVQQQLQSKDAVRRWVAQLSQYQLSGPMMIDIDLQMALEKEGELFDLLTTEAMLSLSGYSHQSPALEQLRDIQPDIIRLDHELVVSMGNDDGRQKIVDTVLDFADRLGIEVMADGVATAGQRGQLMGQGCMLMQGRYFGTPLTLGQLLDHLAVEH